MFSIALIPVIVSMIVYMAVTSAVKILVPLGMYRYFNSFSISVESFIKEGNMGRSCFIVKLSHVLKIVGKLLMQLTAGCSLTGDL